MTKPKLIDAILKKVGGDPTKDFDFLNDQTREYLTKLFAIINALPS
jgi:hypothetical protein